MALHKNYSLILAITNDKFNVYKHLKGNFQVFYVFFICIFYFVILLYIDLKYIRFLVNICIIIYLPRCIRRTIRPLRGNIDFAENV